MSITFTCFCGKTLKAPDEAIGMKAKCPGCGSMVEVPGPKDEAEDDIADALGLGDDAPRMVFDEPPPPPEPKREVVRPQPTPEATRKYAYKVLSQKDKWFSKKFDPESLEEAVNAYAKQGWRAISMATASFTGLVTGHREELIILMERPER